MTTLLSRFAWLAVAVIGAFCLGRIALHRGESISAIWLLAAALATLAIAQRFYARYVTLTALGVEPSRATPAHRRNDGLDYVPTDRVVLFGHHFAAIAGAGPLVGPVLAAQMGYLPGTLWLLAGVVLAGAVQDCVILFLSTRRDGRSLGEMIRREIGEGAGNIAMVGILMIMVILLAVLALVVVKALAQSPWGTFTVAMTIPIALLMGVYVRYWRPGRVLEVSAIGLVLLVVSVWAGGHVAADPALAAMFTFDSRTLAWLLIAYGFVAAVLPVWLLLAPRDYLSTFLKIGTIVLLALAIFWVNPELKMPAVTRFIDGTGPVWAGPLFPFLFITIACGAVSGFHALVSSGTTPKLIDNERDIRVIGYGGMLTECFVAIMALIAAASLEPGLYFAMNSPAALIGTDAASAARVISEWGFVVTPEMLTQAARETGESTLLSRAGGAPTLAVGMAQIFGRIFSGEGMVAFWYHYAILFEALFILTTVDAGTRVGRFMIQDLLGRASPALARTESWAANVGATALCVAGWGWFLYQGVVDPLGGINTLWPLFGIANQMLAGIALTFACVALVKMKRERYLGIVLAPAAWVVVCTTTAAVMKVFSDDVRIGFLAHARRYADALARGEVLAPARDVAEMSRIVLNDRVNASLALFFGTVMLLIAALGARAAWRAWREREPTAREEPYQPLPARGVA
ncbi:MAG TPA: carbon starvation CstA family protein [Candidatus Saccharimonadia bacterium]|nr:carbon starvation CstA family protein [Candidatus Saccharimonadia bacterium]